VYAMPRLQGHGGSVIDPLLTPSAIATSGTACRSNTITVRPFAAMWVWTWSGLTAVAAAPNTSGRSVQHAASVVRSPELAVEDRAFGTDDDLHGWGRGLLSAGGIARQA
jgi:hypothetical protein